MNYSSLSDKAAAPACAYESARTVSSVTTPGVTFTIARMSFGRRVELTRQVRELGQKIDFLQAGSDLKERMEATVLAGEIDRLYLEWGLMEVSGITVDGEPATPKALIDNGPEELTGEVLQCIKAECGLNQAEVKN
ncbi:MAG: hypothetical protein ABI165_01785 [Bryobacteraceae bacterium]